MPANNAEYQREYMRQRRAELRREGRCTRCKCAAADEGYATCAPCRRKNQIRKRREKQARDILYASKGICTRCGKRPFLEGMANHSPRGRYCETCYLKVTSASRLGTTKHWRILKHKLQEQECRCAYTGERLQLGVSDSLDHIYPVHDYPHLASDPDNVEWVTREVNEMKRNRTPDEFLSLIRHILDYRY